MGCCSAVNCANSSRKKFKLFRFPKDAERRKIWLIKCKRDNWQPGPGARLCEVHFEESQFESKREDGWKKLKCDAIPTLFEFNNQLATKSKRVKGIGLPKSGSLLDKVKSNVATVSSSETDSSILLRENQLLANRNKELEQQLAILQNKMSSFLSNGQIKVLGNNRKSISNWPKEDLVKGLKLQLALGKHGYEYLRSTGYPTPAYSTLNRRIKNIKIDFGILHDIINLLSKKVSSMDSLDRLCCLSMDEMEIACHSDFDANTKSFVGQTTLGDKTTAKHYMVVLLRGLRSPWKQVIAHELTGPSTPGKVLCDYVEQLVTVLKTIQIDVVASVSDMGSSNTSMWKAAKVSVTRTNRENFYDSGGQKIFCFADVPHVIKNVRNAFLRHMFILPENICEENQLPSRCVSSGYVKQLWIDEINSKSGLRSLHHLKKHHLFPTHFKTMNVALAVQLFSVKTAASIEKAVSLRQLDKSALTTAWFIRLMDQWFSLMTARARKVGITLRNKEKQIYFLHAVIDVFQRSKFGTSWKPIQTGVILSSLSLIHLTNDLFSKGYKFFLPGRLTQDALENVFSQVRRKSGSKPTGLQAKTALKMICLSQFISDVKNSSYASISDYHLFDDFPDSVESPQLDDISEEKVPQPSTSRQNVSDENDIFYIAGSTFKDMLERKSICDTCKEFLKICEDSKEPEVPAYRQILNRYCDLGGLKFAPSGIYRICLETEKQIQLHKKELLAEKMSINDIFISRVKERLTNVNLPQCSCNVTDKIIVYYFTVRCTGIKNHLIQQKSHAESFSSNSLNKK